MAASKSYSVLVLLLSALLCSSSVWANGDVSTVNEIRSDGVDCSAFKIEIDQHKSKIHVLEKLLEESSKDLKSKDVTIMELEKMIQEKSSGVLSLQSEIESLQRRGSSDAEERAGRARAHAGELQKQVDQLKKDIQSHGKEKDRLGALANEAEKKIQEMNTEMKNLQKINDEQKAKIRKTERALQIAEEEMMNAKFEVTSRIRELMEVHGAWLPPWLARHAIQCQSILVFKWNEHGKPVMEMIIQKTLENKAQIEKWAKPHIEYIKTNYIPAVKEQWLMMMENLEPQVQALTTKSAQAYEALRSAVKPHVAKVKEFADPYYQSLRKFSEPYIDQVATVAKPHVEKARVALKPHTEKVARAYRKFLESATKYHHQVQAAVHEKLKYHELTRPLATKEFVWFVASALLALPIILLPRICRAIFCKKSSRPARGAQAQHHGRRKGKRGHADQ